MKKKETIIENCKCGEKGFGIVGGKFYCIDCYFIALSKFKTPEKIIKRIKRDVLKRTI